MDPDSFGPGRITAGCNPPASAAPEPAPIHRASTELDLQREATGADLAALLESIGKGVDPADVRVQVVQRPRHLGGNDPYLSRAYPDVVLRLEWDLS